MDAALKLDMKVSIRKGKADRTFSTADNTHGLNFLMQHTEGAEPFSVDSFKSRYDGFLSELKDDGEIEEMMKTRQSKKEDDNRMVTRVPWKM